ncbi:MAG TPA: ASPIC/UnbV domain-containing protein, partial [Terriglobales bacterium]|nr:ASPIC/UnbV domain-containing protein [Terriglobales bacterium]
ISNMNARPSLLVNQVHDGNHWLEIKTVGTTSNRDGIGARLTLKVGKRVLVDEVRSGSSYDSNSDMRVHFGLGSATKIDDLQIRWPSGLVERFASLPVDSIHTVREGTGIKLPDPARSASR